MFKKLVMPCLVLGSMILSSSFAHASEELHALTLKAALIETDGQAVFLSPSGSPISIAADSVRGKPYMIAVFPAGFSPGNDSPIDYQWGTVGNDLTYSFTTPAHYTNGPYDALLMVYINTPITDAIKNGDPVDAPPPTKGDICSFTLDDSVVEGNDPAIQNGLVRLNVHDKDSSIQVSNWPLKGTSGDDVIKALTNTVLILP